MTIVKDSSYRNGTLRVVLNLSELRLDILKELKSLEGRLKHTEFNILDVNNLDIKFEIGGAKIIGNWRAMHRERIWYNMFAGHWSHSGWLVLAGYFTQKFELSITNGVLNVVAKSNTISSREWYSFFVDLLVSWNGTNGALRKAIQKGLSPYNKTNISQTLMKFKQQIATKSGLTVVQVEKIIKSTGSLNVDLTSSLINIAIVVPKNLLVNANGVIV